MFVRRRRRNGSRQAGFTAGLVCLGCLLAGVHLEWMFAVVGVLLATTLMMAEKQGGTMWLVFIVGVVTITAF